jgi:hypothetical protein
MLINNNKYEIKRHQISYDDVISHNQDKLKNLGYRSRFGFKEKDDNVWNVSTFFLKGGKGKKEKFYNEKDSIVLDYNSIWSSDGLLVKRHLFRKKVNDKKFVIISLPKYDMKLLNRISLLWISERENDSDTWYLSHEWDENNIEKIHNVTDYLPDHFGNGFFDVVDGKYFYIIPSKDVVYDDNYVLMMNVRGQKGDNDSYDDKGVKGFLSTWVEVDIPDSIEVERDDYRVISEKINNYKNGTSKIEVSMSEMYERLSNQTGDYYDSKTSDKDWFGDTITIKGFLDDSGWNELNRISTTYPSGIEISTTFKENWDGYGRYTPSLDESLDLEDNEKIDMVLDSLDGRRKEVLKRFRNWKKDTSKRLDEIINHLQDGKKSLLKNSKEVDKILKEKVEYDTDLKQFRDTWVEYNLPNYRKDLGNIYPKHIPLSYEDFNKELMVGRYRPQTGILTNLSLDTLKKFRTSSSSLFKGLFERSKISDTSKSRNWNTNKLDLNSGSIREISRKIFGEFYGLGDEDSIVSIPNESRQLNQLQYGSTDYSLFFVDKFVKLVIDELKNFISNNKLKKNHDLYKSEIELLKDKYLRDTNHFFDIPIPTLDRDGENMELIDSMVDYSLNTTESRNLPLTLVIPTKPNPLKKE